MITIGSSPEALATKVETEYRKWSDMLETTRITVN